MKTKTKVEMKFRAVPYLRGKWAIESFRNGKWQAALTGLTREDAIEELDIVKAKGAHVEYPRSK